MTVFHSFRTVLISTSILVVSVLSMSVAAVAGTNNPIALDPFVHEKVGAQPDAVTIAFLDLVKPKAYIVVEDPAGANVAVGDPRLESTNMSVRLKPGLPNGTYTVKYRVEGSNGPEGGAYQFAIGSGDFTIKSIDTWGGYKDIPKALQLPGDTADEAKANASPSTPTPTPTTASSEPTASGQTAGPDSTKNTASTDADGTTWWPWVAGAGVLVLAALLLAAARRRSQSGATDL